MSEIFHNFTAVNFIIFPRFCPWWVVRGGYVEVQIIYYTDKQLVRYLLNIPNDTVLFNIVLGCTYNKQDIQKIIKVTGLEVVLKAKSNRLDSIISENGNNLSGGQKQRILLSRYLFFTHLKKCPILILDESMSALDRVSENIILHNIFEAYPDLSIIMVSHNNLLKGMFDKIIDLK